MNYTAFVSYVLIASFTPGPNNIICMSNTGKYGLKNGLRFNYGVFIGFFMVISACTFLTSMLHELMPKVEPVMLCVGAAYILWLAWTVWRDVPKEGKKPLLQTNSIISGILMQFVNAKGILFAITCMYTFVLPHYSSVPALVVIMLAMSLAGFVATCCWSLFGAALDAFFSGYKKIINAVMALTLVYCAASLLAGLM